MKFANAVVTAQNITTTANGDKAFVSTFNKVLDFFSKAGSMRNVDSKESFMEAYRENPELALRSLLWVRDVRGGAGERKVFKENLEQLAKLDAIELPINFLKLIPEVGRWDDLFVLFGTKYESTVLNLIHIGLHNQNALCAKWMPRKGAIAEKIRKYLQLTPKQYRKMIVGLTSVVETKMCSNQWDDIEYSKVPSVAHNIYKKAFSSHSPEKYNSYKESLTKGEAKINASTLYPHQIVKNLKEDAVIANAQWEALPNYIPNGASVLPMIDLSGSMCTASACSGYNCMKLAIALGLYTATKTEGAFNKLWLNFSEKPRMYKLEGDNLKQYYSSLDFRNWGGSTNILAAFDLILDVAVKNKLTNEDLPKTLMIFSDMQFNSSTVGTSSFESAKQKFELAGYALPNVVFWNLNAIHANQPCTQHESGAMLVSGFSPAIMESVLAGDFDSITPVGLMLKVLLKDRYTF